MNHVESAMLDKVKSDWIRLDQVESCCSCTMIFITTLGLCIRLIFCKIKFYLVDQNSINHVDQLETGILLFPCAIVFVFYLTASNRNMKLALIS